MCVWTKKKYSSVGGGEKNGGVMNLVRASPPGEIISVVDWWMTAAERRARFFHRRRLISRLRARGLEKENSSTGREKKVRAASSFRSLPPCRGAVQEMAECIPRNAYMSSC